MRVQRFTQTSWPPLHLRNVINLLGSSNRSFRTSNGPAKPWPPQSHHSHVLSASVQEVEIKLRLPNQEAHEQVKKALSASHRVQHAQENIFFDGTEGELNEAKRTCRVRFYNGDKKAVITSKGRQGLVNGVGRAEELEEDVDPKEARSFLGEPDKLLNLGSPLMSKLKSEYKVGKFKCLGGFRNMRDEYDYEGFVLELDETIYPWGTVYEIEVETEDPETLKVKLEKFLKDHGIPFKYSSVTKFHNFRKKTLD